MQKTAVWSVGLLFVFAILVIARPFGAKRFGAASESIEKKFNLVIEGVERRDEFVAISLACRVEKPVIQSVWPSLCRDIQSDPARFFLLDDGLVGSESIKSVFNLSRRVHVDPASFQFIDLGGKPRSCLVKFEVLVNIDSSPRSIAGQDGEFSVPMDGEELKWSWANPGVFKSIQINR